VYWWRSLVFLLLLYSEHTPGVWSISKVLLVLKVYFFVLMCYKSPCLSRGLLACAENCLVSSSHFTRDVIPRGDIGAAKSIVFVNEKEKDFIFFNSTMSLRLDHNNNHSLAPYP
jgi:hypothetical protein